MDTGTSAPHQEQPEIVEAPRVTDDTLIPDLRHGAIDQEYPEITPAPRQDERFCPTCGKPL